MKRRNTGSQQEVVNALRQNGPAMSHEMLESEIEGFNRTTLYRILNSTSLIANIYHGNPEKQYLDKGEGLKSGILGIDSM